ncbi:PH domain-containing protein [Companilactobacillus insicii]|uniref:PH domain-containing protein n=1 Tax=Companilactobacillus insicii TaxID=1732567 RepID=UPI000F7AC937|nr:PH domain-containing protein [Companilactobacillus insicii]
MEKVEKLPSSIKTIWRVHAVIEFAVFLVIVLAAGLIKFAVPVSIRNIFDIVEWSIIGIGLILLIVSFFWVVYLWNFWTYYIDERQVQLHSGYFFRKQVVIPIARVQNVTLKQGPILRWKNLQKVVIVTAAGQSEIDGIESKQADKLKETIMKLAQEAKNDI